MAEEMPPPIAPPDSICIVMKPGNTSAIPVSASRPRRETNHVSIRPVEDCASITSTLGHAMLSMVDTIGPFNRRLVRAFITSDPFPPTTWARGTAGDLTRIVAALMGDSPVGF